MNYIKKMQLISGYVDFNYKTINRKNNFTRKQKWLITRYYNELYDVEAVLRKTATEFKSFKAPNKKELNKLKKLAGLKGKRINRIPVPVVNAKSAKIRMKNGALIIDDNNVTRIINSWGDVDDNPLNSKTRHKLVNGITKKYKKDAVYNVQCGQFEIKGVHATKEFIEQRVKHLQNTYLNSDKWLFGLVSYEFDNQADHESYIKRVNELKHKPKKKLPKTNKQIKKARAKKKNK